MAKIQITTVEMKSNAQVIVLNANFVSRVVKAYCAMESMYCDRLGPDYDSTVTVGEVYQFTQDVFALLRDITHAFEADEEKEHKIADNLTVRKK